MYKNCLAFCGLDLEIVRLLACCVLLSSLVFCKENGGDMKQESAILPVHSSSSAAQLQLNAVNYLLLADEYLRQILEDQKQLLTALTSSGEQVHTKRAASAPFSGGIYGKRGSLPFSGGVYGKRANLPYSGGVYGKRANLPYSGGVYGKRANLPFSGGVYGKRASLPFSGGVYGKRANNMVSDISAEHEPMFLDRISIRAMPVNGGMYGKNLFHTATSKSKPYHFEPTSYKRDGFQIIGSELADDPLTNVRTMRNRLQQVAVNSAGRDLEIKAELAQAASDSLAKAELQLVQLHSKRSDGLFSDDSKTAEKLTRQMKEVSERAIYDAYADILMDGEEVQFYLHRFSNFLDSSIWSALKVDSTLREQKDALQKARSKKSHHHHHSHGERTFLNKRREISAPSEYSSRNSSSHHWDTASGWSPIMGGNTHQNPSENNSSEPHFRSREISKQTLHSPPAPPISPLLSNTSSAQSVKYPREILVRPYNDRPIFDNSHESLYAKRRSSTENERPIIKTIQRPSSENNPRRTTFSPPEPQLKTKKNERLGLGGPQKAGFGVRTDGKKEGVISSAAICPYCMGRDPGFVNPEYLKQHMAENCNPLTKCEFCDKIVETSELNDHHLNRCPFVEDSLEACVDCGLARYPGKDRHPKCRGKKPPDGAAWCPLCSSKVEPANLRDVWMNHLSGDTPTHSLGAAIRYHSPDQG
uniref:Centrosomal protein CEP104 Zn finger domain-containing protein n=1 Tax=Ditylenchus dipsaci TaxID=166011 RepID=A0A915DQA2_9BILA